MQMSVRVTDNRKKLDALMGRAADSGLVAAADVLVRAVKHALSNGYRGNGNAVEGGGYSTGRVRASVRRSEVERAPNGTKLIRVGSNVKYALYWELGHWAWPAYYSEKLRRWVSIRGKRNQREYRRSEKWVPTALEKQTEMANAYARTVTRVINQGMPK